MKTFEMEDQIRVIDARTLRIEQTMVTKDDLKAFATKDDLKAEIDLVVQAMRHETGILAARSDGLAARIDGLDAKSDTLAAKSDGLAARMDRIEARIATVATKQQLDEAVSKLATKDQMAGLEQRLGNSIAELGKQLASLKPRRRTRGR